MSFWSYCASLRFAFSLFDFCTAYFVTLLGRCAILSFPLLGIVILLRWIMRNSTFAKGAAWAAMVPVLFLGKLAIYYQNNRLFLPLIHWQSWCCGYWWLQYGYLAGVAVSLTLLIRRRVKLSRILRGLPSDEIDGRRIYLCDLMVSPFTAGVLSPKIVIPRAAKEQLCESELRTVLLHERTHIALGHLWYFLFWDVLCALLWVNPFLRMVTPKLKEDMEQICDAVTIQHGDSDALTYGCVLLKSMTLLRDTSASLPVTFAGENDFTDAKQRMYRVRDYHPYSYRRVRSLAASVVCLLLLALLVIWQASLPRYSELDGFSIVHVSTDVRFTTMYESETDDPPITLHGNRADVDCTALRALLPKEVPRDGWYYIMWGGFMKIPGIGGGLNSICVGSLPDGSTASTEFQDVNDLLYVKLAKWI